LRREPFDTSEPSNGRLARRFPVYDKGTCDTAPMTVACIVLDFDGTVLDTEEPIYRSWWELWDDHGHELERPAWQSIIGTDGAFDPLAALEERLGRRLDAALVASRLLRRDELQAAHDVRDGIVGWLDRASELGVPVGIASSSPQDWVDGHLQRLGLRERFTVLTCAGEGMPAKPDPTSYRVTCERLGADPGRSVAVEDSPHGVRAAVAAGLFTVAVPHGLTADLDLSAAHVVAESLEHVSLDEALRRAAGRFSRERPTSRD
jgi:HAD superfamily hydrolase (TIGR01509 family)